MLTVRTFQVVFARIKANFIWAMAYNLVLIPVAMGLLFPLTHSRLPPAYAGLAMAFSSVSVVLSSLSLKLYAKPLIDDDGTIDREDGCMSMALTGLGLGCLNHCEACPMCERCACNRSRRNIRYSPVDHEEG